MKKKDFAILNCAFQQERKKRRKEGRKEGRRKGRHGARFLN